ncbi:MAG: peptide ABC transporter substrate-binding protein [Pseudomonadota bacterium]|nr:peptide ABC transporter substrate-binding protein [Pseudomonadota bacterium]
MGKKLNALACTLVRTFLLGLLTAVALMLLPLQLQAEAVKQIIRIGNGTEPRELDPILSTGVPESHIEDNIFEGLCSRDPLTEKTIPGAAESWEISEDGLTYTFKLRKNLKWSDGVKLTAHDFVYSWRLALDPKTASEYAYQLYYIKNGEAFNKKKITDNTKIGVVAQDDRTLVVTLERPTPYFLDIVAFHTLYPVPKHVIAKHKEKWTKEGNIVGNGAFKLVEWRLNQHIKLVPNEHYWDKDKVKIQEAYFLPIEKAETEEKSFAAGQLDMTATLPTVKIATYMRDKQKNPKTSPFRRSAMFGTYYYQFNTKAKPLDNKLVRQALSLTVDRTLIAEKVARGGQIPAWSFVPPIEGKYQPKKYLNTSVSKADIAKAKALLKKAGFPDGKGMPKIELLYNTSEGHKKIALAIQQMWKKHLGVQIKLLNQEWKVYLNTTRSGKFQISRRGWIGDYLDPNTFMDLHVEGGGNNEIGFAHPEHDKYIKLAAAESNNKKRMDYFHKAEAILLDEAVVMPIYYYVSNRLVSPKVKLVDNKGKLHPWRGNLFDRLPLKHYVMTK